MKKRTYSEMKDSGVEWIGEIPKVWEIFEIEDLYSIRNIKVNDEDYPPLSVTMKGILPQLKTVAKSDDHSNRKLVRKSDFVINSRSDRKGACGISQYEGSVSLINIVLEPIRRMYEQYYNLVFHTAQFSDEFYKWGHGIVDDLWTTSWQDMKKISVIFPSLSEQTAIADYLDAKCAQIDEIISETKKCIEEYKQWKSAVIFEAVTKGLDPNAEMKDSGVEWIGKIPKEWSIIKIKNVADLDPNCHKPLLDICEVSFAPMDCIRTSQRIEKVALLSMNNDSYSSFNNGDIALAKVSPCFENKNVCIMDNLKNMYAFGSSELYNLRSFNIITRFLLYWLQTDRFIENGVACMTGVAGLKRIPSLYVKNACITYPPLPEQTAIADYLDAKCAQIDEIISEREALIWDLELYKKSLIYEVVTGKIRVS